MDDRYYKLDLLGDEHLFDKKEKIYTLKRHYGLFSNLNVMTYGILKFYKHGYKSKNLKIYLVEYDDTIDFYDNLFSKSDNDYYLDNISSYEINNHLEICYPNHLGVGFRKEDINFKIFNIINDKFFKPNNKVKNIIRNIEEKNNINYDNSVFIWARKTDKVTETNIPNANDYIKILNGLQLKNMDIIIQSDDKSVYDEFNTENFIYKNLNELPLSEDSNIAFYTNLNRLTNDEYYNLYGHSKIEYLQKTLALVHIASKCNTVIIYPGNLATYIPIIRGNWNNVYSFKNDKELFK
jgi:hypothetical protein